METLSLPFHCVPKNESENLKQISIGKFSSENKNTFEFVYPLPDEENSLGILSKQFKIDKIPFSCVFRHDIASLISHGVESVDGVGWECMTNASIVCLAETVDQTKYSSVPRHASRQFLEIASEIILKSTVTVEVIAKAIATALRTTIQNNLSRHSGETSLIGGVVLPIANSKRSIFIFVSCGASKAYRFHNEEICDLTQGRILPEGKLGDDPQWENLIVRHTFLVPDDMLILCSSTFTESMNFDHLELKDACKRIKFETEVTDRKELTDVERIRIQEASASMIMESIFFYLLVDKGITPKSVLKQLAKHALKKTESPLTALAFSISEPRKLEKEEDQSSFVASSSAASSSSSLTNENIRDRLLEVASKGEDEDDQTIDEDEKEDFLVIDRDLEGGTGGGNEEADALLGPDAVPAPKWNRKKKIILGTFGTVMAGIGGAALYLFLTIV